MKRIEEMGGAVEAIESGYYHKAILDEAYRWEQAVNEGERVVVGVNKYRDDDEPEPEYFKVDQTMASEQRAKLEKLRAERELGQGGARTRRAAAAAEGGGNLMPAIIESVHAYAPRRDLRSHETGVRRVQGARRDLKILRLALLTALLGLAAAAPVEAVTVPAPRKPSSALQRAIDRPLRKRSAARPPGVDRRGQPVGPESRRHGTQPRDSVRACRWAQPGGDFVRRGHLAYAFRRALRGRG